MHPDQFAVVIFLTPVSCESQILYVNLLKLGFLKPCMLKTKCLPRRPDCF